MNIKKILSMILCVSMLLGMMTFTASAENDFVAKIGETEYTDFDEALTAANALTGAVEVEIYDKVTLNKSFNGSYSSIKFTGKNDSAEIYLDVQGYITASGKDVAFENLKLSKVAGGYIYDAGFMNLAFGVFTANTVSYNNCIFLNGAYASRANTTFTGCTFYRSHDRYGLWAYGDVDCIVEGCTFADIRGIKMFDEGAGKVTNLTVKNTDFSVADNKPAIVLTHGESVVLENNTYSEKGVFELDLDGTPNGTAVTSDVPPTCINDNGECGVLVDGKIYTTVAQAAAVAEDGSVVTLLHNTDETVSFENNVIFETNEYSAPNVKLPVARIGGVYYTSIQDAVNSANAGDVIVLEKDVEAVVMPTADSTSNPANALIVVAADDTVELDLNGHSVAVTGNPEAKYDTLAIRNHGNLTISDSSAEKTGKISFTNTATQETGSSQIHSTILNFGTLTINGGTIENTALAGKARYTINNYSWGGNARLTVNGGTISSSSTVAIYASNYNDFGNKDNTVIVNDGKIEGGIWCAFTSAGTADYVMNVTGGTVTGGTNPSLTVKVGSGIVADVGVSGGTFSDDVSEYVADGFIGTVNEYGFYTVVTDDSIAGDSTSRVTENVSVKFEKIAENKYDVVLEADTNAQIHRFLSAELDIEVTADNNSTINLFSVEGNKDHGIEVIDPLYNESGVWGFHLNDEAKDVSANSIVIGTVTLTGYGSGDIAVVANANNKVEAIESVNGNIVKKYNADLANFNIPASATDVNIKVPTQKLTIKISFPNAISESEKAYQDMQVVVTGKDIDGYAYDLGSNGDVALNADGCYVIEMVDKLTKDNSYNILVTGAGYRTAKYRVTMTEDKTVYFWNNAIKDGVKAYEEGGIVKTAANFLAGDIAEDNIIDKYDLAAVVSYFGKYELKSNADLFRFNKYDLNRDGKIDSEDIAYVLASFGY